jgi:hypothetical protein
MNTSVPAEAQPFVDWARAYKEEKVEGTTVGQNDDIAPLLEFRRDGQVVALVFCNNVSRDEALQAASVGVPGWSVDHLVMALDAHYSDERFFKRYGRTPDPHELQELCDKEGACELGLITDALMVVEGWRSGRLRISNVPYHVHKSARTVHWIEDDRCASLDTEESKGHVEGIVPDAVRDFFSSSTLDQNPELDPREFGLEPGSPEVRIHQDLAVMTVLVGAGFGVALNTPTPLHEEMLQRTLDRTHGLELHTRDGTVRRSEAKPDALTLLSKLTSMKLANERDRQHEAELAERDRRRAARAAGTEPTRSLQEIFDDLTGR